MTSLRLFVCQPYGARITPSACAKRYPRQVGRQSAGAGPRADRVHCHECPVGAAHARGEDAPGVEYSLVEVDAPAPPREPVTRTVASSRGSDVSSGRPTPQKGDALGSNAGSTKGVTARRDEHSTTTEDPMPEPETPTPRRAAKKCARAWCGAWFTPTGPRSLYCEQHRATPTQNQQAKERMRAMRERRKALEDVSTALDAAAARAPSSTTKDVEEAASEAKCSDHLDPWPAGPPAAPPPPPATQPAAFITADELTPDEVARAHADAVLTTAGSIEVVPIRWLLDERSKVLSRLRKVVDDDAHASAFRADEAMRELREVRTTVIERGERIEVLQREFSTAEARIASFVRAEDRLQAAMLGLIDVHLACRDDLDEEETAAMFDALDAGKLTRLARELADYIRSLREAPKVEKQRTFVEAFVEAITPPPGVSAAAVLRAVGYQVVTVDSPRGPVIVVEGAAGG